MLVIEPVIDARLNRAFVAQTFTRWHGGVAREDYADAWLAETGALTPAESEAIAVRREALCAGEGGGCDLIRRLARDEVYAAWVMAGAAQMQPVAARYIDVGRTADEAIVREAFGIFEATHAAWSAARTSNATPAGAG
jgi:hypothetical protein